MRKLFLGLLCLVSFNFAAQELDSSNFEQTIKGKNAIIDFYAHWCPPCKEISEHLDFYAQNKDNDVQIYKVNVDLNVELSIKYKADNLPTLVYIKNGEVVLTKMGFQDFNDIEENVNNFILK